VGGCALIGVSRECYALRDPEDTNRSRDLLSQFDESSLGFRWKSMWGSGSGSSPCAGESVLRGHWIIRAGAMVPPPMLRRADSRPHAAVRVAEGCGFHRWMQRTITQYAPYREVRAGEADVVGLCDQLDAQLDELWALVEMNGS